MRVGIIGMGKMGEALVLGLSDSEDSLHLKIEGTTRSQASASEVKRRLGIPCGTNNSTLARNSDIIILAIKPHQAEEVLKGIRKELTEKKIVISVCASLTTAQLSEWAGGKAAIIRTMPNTPCLIREGMTVLTPGPRATIDQLKAAESIFSAVGKTAIVEESLMDGVTGLSGSGPAYIYLVIEALSDAGVKVGLPRKTATLLAAQTLLGSAKMVLSRGEHPAALKDEVTTPAGCTIDGLMALEEGKLRVTLIKAVLASTKRSKSLRG